MSPVRHALPTDVRRRGGGAPVLLSPRASTSVARLAAIAFITATATLVQAYLPVKAAVLFVFLAASLSAVYLRGRMVVHLRLVAFYVVLGVIGAIWGVVGLLHAGNSVVGVEEALRLYCLWSLAFLVIFSLLRAAPSLLTLHTGFVAAGITISVLTLVALADQFLGWGLVSTGMREQLELYIAVHDGYVQITSNNIGALFPIVPYLISIKLWRPARDPHPRWTTCALGLSLLVAVLSGRRALWLVMALTPCTLLTLAVLARCSVRFGRATVRSLWMYAVLGAFAGMFAVVAPEVLPETGFVAHLQEAFSSVDERTIQKPFLLQAFAEEPVLGSGFGAAAGYLRNYERPWTGYELTYHQMLFNLGIVGSTMLAAVFVSYVVMVILLLRRYGEWGAIPFALLLGCVSLLMGAYSNRYFGSFDYLFFVGILPYLATFTRGFHEGSPGRAVSG